MKPGETSARGWLTKKESIGLLFGLQDGLTYAVVFDGHAEIERLTLEKLDGRTGTLLAWVPIEWCPT